MDIEKARNLGPVSAKALRDIDVNTVENLIEKGWQQTIIELVLVHPKFINLNMCRALIGAIHGIDWREISPAELIEAKEILSKLR